MKTIGALVVLLLAPAVGSTQVLSQLTPAQVAEAIALGSRPKDARSFLDLYRLRTRVLGSTGRTIGVFTTPFSRIVALALDAHERYATLTAADIPPEALNDDVEVHAWPMVVSERRLGQIASVRTVVLTPSGSRARAAAIQPTRTSNAVTKFANLFGATAAGESVTAVFQPADFIEGRDIHVVFTERIDIGTGTCEDCNFAIKLRGIR